MTTVPSPREVSFSEIDKTRFFGYGTVLFLGLRAFVYPINVTKTRRQLGLVANPFTIAKQEGLVAFYRGFATSSGLFVPGQILFISTLEFVKERLQDTPLQPARNLIAGSCAAATAALINVPADVISQRLSVQRALKLNSDHYKNGRQAFLHIMRTEGVGGFYRGFPLAVLLSVPSSATWWGIYGHVRQPCIDLFTESGERESSLIAGSSSPRTENTNLHMMPPLHALALAGGLSGMFAGLLTNPLDVLKTYAQVMQTKDQSVFTVIRDVWVNHGVRGLMRGMWARAAQSAPWSAAIALSYEYGKYALSTPQPDDA